MFKKEKIDEIMKRYPNTYWFYLFDQVSMVTKRSDVSWFYSSQGIYVWGTRKTKVSPG